MGRLLTRLPRLTLAQLRRGCDAPVNSRGSVPQRGLPITTMGRLLSACLDSRLHNCGPRSGQLYSRYVPQRPEISQRPYGKITDVLASTLFRTTAADALVNYSLMYLLQETLNISHRPHGRLTFCLLFAGRRCLRRFRHGHDNVLLDLREYSLLCACSCSKVPITPMGKSRTCLP